VLEIQVINRDVRDIDCDVLVLKYAQDFYGADLAVANALSPNGAYYAWNFTPRPGEHTLVDS